MAENKTGSLVSIVLWSVVLILALSAGVIGLVLMTTDSNILFNLALFAIGIYLFIFSFKKIIAGNDAWKSAVKDEILAEQDDILGVWVYTQKNWELFVEKELASKRKTAIKLTAITTALVFIGAVLGALGQGDLDGDFWKIALPIVIGLALMMWYMISATDKNLREIYLAYQESKQQPGVIIGKKGVVVNGKLLISFNPVGGNLVNVKEIDLYEVPVLSFGIKTRNGSRSVVHQYAIPIPKDREEEAQEVAQRVRSVYELSD